MTYKCIKNLILKAYSNNLSDWYWSSIYQFVSDLVYQFKFIWDTFKMHFLIYKFILYAAIMFKYLKLILFLKRLLIKRKTNELEV